MTNWRNSGSEFYVNENLSTSKNLPAGIYEIKVDAFGVPFLFRNSDNFHFEYKLYGVNSFIIEKILNAWTMSSSSLGILLNGLKGTGKSVTAKLVANACLLQKQPVIVIKNKKTQIESILSAVYQPCVVIFDEFEKVYDTVEDQQRLLSIIDGVNVFKHPRLFIFTTNTPKVDENFLDRPNRIRYIWNFDNLDAQQVLDIIDSELLLEREDYRIDILNYLAQRKVVSVDTVKAVLEEINKFNISPKKFESYFNISKKNIYGISYEYYLDGEWHKPSRILLPYSGEENLRNCENFSNMFIAKQLLEDKDKIPQYLHFQDSCKIIIQSFNKDFDCLNAYIMLHDSDTWRNEFVSNQSQRWRWLNSKEDWVHPSILIKNTESKKRARVKEELLSDCSSHVYSLYDQNGYFTDSSNMIIVPVRLTPLYQDKLFSQAIIKAIQ